MARKAGKVRKQQHRVTRQAIVAPLAPHSTHAKTHSAVVRAVGDGKLTKLGNLPVSVGEQLGEALPTLRVGYSRAYLHQHVRSALRRRYSARLKQVIEGPDFVGRYGESQQRWNRLTIVKRVKTDEYLGIGLDLVEDNEGWVYVISTLRQERPNAIRKRVEGLGKLGSKQRLQETK